MEEIQIDKDEFSKFKLMYDNNYDELNRCRDWPVKVLAFASALYAGLIGFVTLKSENQNVLVSLKIGLSVVVIWFSFYIITILKKQHLEYLKYRNIQIRLQKKLDIHAWTVNNEKIFTAYEKELPVKTTTNALGWKFYRLYVITITSFAIVSLWLK